MKNKCKMEDQETSIDLGPLQMFRSMIWFKFNIMSLSKVRNDFGMK